MGFGLYIYNDEKQGNTVAQYVSFIEAIHAVYSEAPGYLGAPGIVFRTNGKGIKPEDIKPYLEPAGENQFLISFPYKDNQNEFAYVESHVNVSPYEMSFRILLDRLSIEIFDINYNEEKMIELVKECAKKILPSQISCGIYFDNPQGGWIEYCREPSYYCIELSRESQQERGAYIRPYMINREDEEQLKLLPLIKSALAQDKIIEIIKEHHGGNELFEISGGIGIIRKSGGSNSVDFVYPRYFVRKEARKRGVKLFLNTSIGALGKEARKEARKRGVKLEGLAERFANELGLDENTP